MIAAQPIAGFRRGAFQPLRPEDMREVPLGMRLDEVVELVAGDAPGPIVMRASGEWLLRESWRDVTRPGDVIELYEAPQDRDTLRGALLIASFFIPQLFALQGTAAFLAVTAAQLAINTLLPPSAPGLGPRGPERTADAFAASISGNQARIDEPIWKILGRRELNPPFACQPYLEFLPRVGESDPNLDREQYLYALYAVQVGNSNVVAKKIANTPLTRFADVVRAEYLAPGVQPTTVLPNVYTADEVSSEIMESGQYVGGFVACKPRRTCEAIGIDVAATRGLGKTSSLTVTWQVEYRQINDFGQVIGDWTILANESRTAYTASPQRWSNKYELTSDAGRVEVRVVRTDTQDTDANALHEIAWIGLRGYLADPAPLNPHTGHFELVMRASSQLSNQASRDVRLIVESLCRTWDPIGGWGAEVHTRNGAWWMLDLITSSTWGMQRPDSRVDLQSFYELALTAEARQDRCDMVLQQTMNAWDALQMIARTMRARVFRRNGLISVARDELADLPVTMFSHRNCLPGISIVEMLRDRTSPDGVIIEYEDHRTPGEWQEIVCPCPGAPVTSELANPVYIRIPGIVGATHAEREGRYEAARIVYRTRTAQWSTELQGMLPAYMSPVYVLPELIGYGQSGDVVEWDEPSLTMTLSEPLDFVTDALFLTLVRDDGTVTAPVAVTPGASPNTILLPEPPDFELELDAPDRERPKYMLGLEVSTAEIVRVASIEPEPTEPSRPRILNLSGPIEDNRVHEVDEDLLPSSSDEIQDPVGNPDDASEGGGTLYVVRVLDHTIAGVYLSGVGDSSQDIVATYNLLDDGTATWSNSSGTSSDSGSFTQEWLQFGTPVDPSVAALYEVKATILASLADLAASDTLTGPIGTWEAFPQTWELTWVSPRTPDPVGPPGGGVYRILKIEIRKIATGIVEDSANITLQCLTPESGGGD